MKERVAIDLLWAAADDLETAAKLISGAADILSQAPDEQVIPNLPPAVRRFAENCQTAAEVVRSIPT